MDSRCPETMWLVHNPRLYITGDEPMTPNDVSILNSTSEMILKNNTQTPSKVLKSNKKHRLLQRTKALSEHQPTTKQKTATIIVSIIVTFIYFGKINVCQFITTGEIGKRQLN